MKFSIFCINVMLIFIHVDYILKFIKLSDNTCKFR